MNYEISSVLGTFKDPERAGNIISVRELTIYCNGNEAIYELELWSDSLVEFEEEAWLKKAMGDGQDPLTMLRYDLPIDIRGNCASVILLDMGLPIPKGYYVVEKNPEDITTGLRYPETPYEHLCPGLGYIIERIDPELFYEYPERIIINMEVGDIVFLTIQRPDRDDFHVARYIGRDEDNEPVLFQKFGIWGPTGSCHPRALKYLFENERRAKVIEITVIRPNVEIRPMPTSSRSRFRALAAYLLHLCDVARAV